MILSSEFNCGVMKPVWHSHTFCELIYLNKGEAVFSFEQSRIRIREHQMILITALEPHSVESNRPEYERFCLRLSPRDVMDALANPLLSCVFASRQKNAFFVFDASDDPLLFQSIFRHLDTVFHQKNELSDYEIRAGLQTLFSAAFRRQEKVFFDAYTENPELRKAMDFLNRHYAEAIRIDEVAKSFFWSPAYFSHAFKQFSGYSPKQYLTLFRMTRAKELLRTTDSRVREIASLCGFGDENNFIRLFRRSEGTTPREYRNRYRKKASMDE